MPANFWISQLPREVLYFVTRALQIAASSLGAAKKPETKMPTAFGADGWDSVGPAEADPPTHSLCYPTTRGSSSPKLSFSATEPPAGVPPVTLPELVRAQWYRALCVKSQATWLRRFGAISGTAPCTSRGAPTCVPLSDPYEDPPKNQQRAITPKLLRAMFVK